MKKIITQILGIGMVITGGIVAVFYNKPGAGGIIIATGLWIGSLLLKK